MRSRLMIAVAASALMMTLDASPALALAPGGGGGGMGGMGGVGTMSPGTQMPRGDLDRTQDRLRDKDMLGDKDQDRDRLRDKDQTGDKDQDRDRDRLHTSQVVEDQIASLSLLTSAERTQFQSEMRAAKTVEERNQIRAEHQKTIRDRAREMGIEAPAGAGMGPGAGAGAGAGTGMGMNAQNRAGYMLMTMLTEQERAQFMNRLQSAQTAQERQTIRNEMHVMAQQRAREMGVDVPDWYGQGVGPR